MPLRQPPTSPPQRLARTLCVSLLMYAAFLSPFRQQVRAFNVVHPLSMSMSASSSPSAQKLRVVTYNILTPNYATPRDLPVRTCPAYSLLAFLSPPNADSVHLARHACKCTCEGQQPHPLSS